MRGLSSGVHLGEDSIEGSPVDIRQGRDVRIPAEDVDVEIARGPGDLPQPTEPLPILVAHRGGYRPLALGEHSAGAAYGHAQLMEELRIGVRDGSLEVGVDHRGEMAEHLAEPGQRVVVDGEGHGR